MGKRFTQFLVLGVCLLFVTGLASAQVSNTGRLIGTVTDPTGAVVVGADVKIADEATGKSSETKSGNDGGFAFAGLDPGSYTVTVTIQGFKKAEVRAVKIMVGRERTLTVQLELGEMASTVVIEAGTEILQTSETKVGTTIAGKAITSLPFSSRDALDLAILMPGAQTVGRPRATSFNGLPKGALNITMDGINVQDSVLKSSDGFFTLIRPRVDTIEEFSITSAAGGAGETGEGAVVMRFETKRGTNDFHGGAWWYHRNDKMNSNYYFNNQKASVPTQIAATPKQKQRLNQFGAKIGGPILKDKLFFFTAVDFYRNPQSQSRTRTILTDEATAGTLRYSSTFTGATPAWVTCNGTQCTANLLQMAAANTFPSAVDLTTSFYLSAMNSSLSVPGVSLVPTTSLITRSIRFNNTGADRRNFPDFRFDYNMNKNHSITAIYHYNFFGGGPDFLNGADATFPVFPFNTNQGSQGSQRNELVSAWRWNMGSTKTNEVRIGLISSPVSFFPDLNISLYPEFATNLGSIRVQPSFNLVSQPLLGFNTQGRNGGLLQLIETFSWTRGKHNFTFGGNWTENIFKDFFASSAVGSVGMGITSDDPANGMFGTGNLPGSATTDQGNARALYSMLVGRVSSFGASQPLNPVTRQFEQAFPFLDRVRSTEIAMYATDNWRLFSTLTMNVGVRWDWQGAPRDGLNQYFRLNGDFLAAVAGRSCSANNLFTPGNLTCAVNQYVLPSKGDKEYNNDLDNFAPSIGLAWTPNMEGNIFKWLLGGPGKSVFRAGYSIAYTREGLNNYFGATPSNPGYSASLNAAASSTASPGNFVAGTVSLASAFVPNVASTPPAFVESFNISPQTASQTVRVYNPKLNIPYVQSWQVGWQREVTPSTVVEVRYVGNHGTGLWRNINLNEINIFQPNMTVGSQALTSFLTEFNSARNNLAICRANQVACRTAAGSTSSTFASYANLLPGSGTVPLPIMTAAFTGTFSQSTASGGAQRNTNFASAALIANLDNFAAGSMANTVGTTLSFWNNLVAAGIPANFFRLNPDARGGALLFGNGSHTTYNALQIEVRRRLSKGLQFNGNYVFSKSLTNLFADSSTNQVSFSTLRNPRYDKGPSPWDLRHAFKMQLIYELPFGPGKKWSSSQGWLNRVIEGWEINTITRWQSGRITPLSGGLGGTVNAVDGGIELIGITPKQLQEQLEIRKTTNGSGLVYWFPASLIGSDGRANPSVLRACRTPGAFCQRLFVNGPQFFRPDWSISKRTKLSEKVNIEYRAEFLNAFNNQNFFFGGSAAGITGTVSLQSVSFGQIADAYQDVSTTNDNGGRILQMVLRINF